MLLFLAREAYGSAIAGMGFPRQRRQRDKTALPPYGSGSIEMPTGSFVRHVADTRPSVGARVHILLAPTVAIPVALAIAVLAYGFYLRSGLSGVGLQL
jgi:hypothetical protein